MTATATMNSLIFAVGALAFFARHVEHIEVPSGARGWLKFANIVLAASSALALFDMAMSNGQARDTIHTGLAVWGAVQATVMVFCMGRGSAARGSNPTD